MRADTLKSWLRERGCRFESASEERGNGQGSVTVKLGGKSTTLPGIGSHQDLDPRDVMRIVAELGLVNEPLPEHAEDAPHDPYKSHRAGQRQ